MTVYETFRKRLKSEIEKQNISLENMAEHLKVDVPMVRGYLSGSSVPNLIKLGEICCFLKISADYLLGRVDEFGNKTQS